MQAREGEVPSGSAWGFEFVWDGLRALAYLRGGRVQLLSGGSARSLTASYPELSALAALADTRGELVLDGKIVVLDDLDRPDAARLRQRTSTSRPSPALLGRVPVLFYLLDLLHADGRPTLSLPYQRRRELLAELDLTGLPARLPPYFLDTDGQTMLEVAQRHGLGGVLAKRLDSHYQPGRRSRAWVQTLPRQLQRVVIGGWQPVARAGGGDESVALLVGVPEPAGLRYVARVTAGLDPPARRELAGRLDALVSSCDPFREPPPDQHTLGVRWVTPRLVGEVSYRRWEIDGRLRHARWIALCPDAHPATATVHGPMGLTTGEPPVSSGSELAALDQAVRLAKAEVRALRAQISPHFLYNALTTIATYVRTDPAKARELLGEFAEYTRYAFRSGSAATTLGAELANAERYLAIEAARFGERLAVTRHVAPELREVSLPFLTLQPLVENAVRHGIEGAPRGGTVGITAEPDGPDCVITVSDDGLGMDPDRLTETITDVRERLSAAGHSRVFRVDTAPGTGTTVTIRVPIRDPATERD
ncbi:MAG: histidine kinase [Actinomycetota bacterium]|nr:histidine kinase [Actinomycetota bacterium]